MRILVRVAVTLGLIVLLFSSYLSWRSDYLVSEIKQQKSIEAVLRYSSRDDFPVLAVDPLKLVLRKASFQTNIDNQAIIELLGIYLSRRPFDAAGWVILSQFYQRVGQIDLASQALDVAHRLSESNTSILLKVFNRYLELGLIEKALPVAHDIAYARPYEFRRLFYLMGRLSNDYPLVVNQMIPVDVPVLKGEHKELDSNVYFKWALTDAMRAQNTLLAQAVWDAMPLQFKRHTRVGGSYINYLVELQDLALVEPVWFDVVGSEMPVAQLLENNQADLFSPCWQVTNINGVDLTVGDKRDGVFSLQLAFLGGRNVAYHHSTCIVRVIPGEQYLLTGRSKGEGITTLSGPFLDVFYPSIKSSYTRTESMIGTWHWTDFQLFLDVPEGAHFAKIRVRRAKTELLDSKISGDVWFENIKLEASKKVSEDLSGEALQ